AHHERGRSPCSDHEPDLHRLCGYVNRVLDQLSPVDLQRCACIGSTCTIGAAWFHNTGPRRRTAGDFFLYDDQRVIKKTETGGCIARLQYCIYKRPFWNHAYIDETTL